MSLFARIFGTQKAVPESGVANNVPNPVHDANGYLRWLLETVPPGTDIPAMFGNVPDGFWLWANTEGMRQSEALRSLLPGLPDEETQRNFTGASGDVTLTEAFMAYLLFREAAERGMGRSLREADAVLDFGCGWGRIIRFFLRDLPGNRLQGIDCYPEVVDVAKETNRYCRFEQIGPMPPVESLPDASYDLIYAFSVFSHLSEEAATRWIVEFKRLLKPGGIIAVTTRARDFIEFCAKWRKEQRNETHILGPIEAFPDTAQALADYDRGKFMYSPVGGGGVLDASFFGETCIPKKYVVANWTKHLQFVDFIEDRSRCIQNVIVMKK